jgi:hypothetical protein
MTTHKQPKSRKTKNLYQQHTHTHRPTNLGLPGSGLLEAVLSQLDCQVIGRALPDKGCERPTHNLVPSFMFEVPVRRENRTHVRHVVDSQRKARVLLVAFPQNFIQGATERASGSGVCGDIGVCACGRLSMFVRLCTCL